MAIFLHLLVFVACAFRATATPVTSLTQNVTNNSLNGSSTPSSPGSGPYSPVSPPVSPFARCTRAPVRGRAIEIYTDWHHDPELGCEIQGYWQYPTYLCFDIFDENGGAVAHYESSTFRLLVRELVNVQRWPDFDGMITAVLIPKTIRRDTGIKMNFAGVWAGQQIQPLAIRFESFGNREYGVEGIDDVGLGGGGNITAF